MIDDIINSVNNLVYQAISSLENGLTATPPARLGFKASKAQAPASDGDGGGHENAVHAQAKQEIDEGLHQLETLLESTVDKNFDKFEIYVLRNILSVPEELAAWIRLSHYQVCVGFLFPSLIQNCRIDLSGFGKITNQWGEVELAISTSKKYA